jgi:hypothetical protein
MMRVCLFVALGAMFASAAAAQHEHAHHAHGHAMSDKPEVITRCTQGSFIDSINIVHASVRAIEHSQLSDDAAGNTRSSSDAVAPKNLKIVQNELQSILSMSLARVAAEAKCQQALEASFKASYLKILSSAERLATTNDFAPHVIRRAKSAKAAVNALRESTRADNAD